MNVIGWSNVDWQRLNAVTSKLPPNSHSGVDVSHTVSVVTSATYSASVSPTSLTLVSTIQPVSNEPTTSTDKFVSAIDMFNELVGSCDVSARFAKNPNWCLANNEEYGKRCRTVSGTSLENYPVVAELLAQLERLNFESNLLKCVDKLLVLTNLAVCKKQRKAIREKVDGLLQQRQIERPHDEKGFHKYLPYFLPFRSSELAKMTVNRFVVQQATEPFNIKLDPKKKLGEGFLYIYWNAATFGVRKIGSTNDVGARLTKWEKDCKHGAVEQYRSPRKVRHVARVEQLVHADLSDYRVFEPACRGCLKSHIEWFSGLSLALIIRRIEAWSQWIDEKPYEEVDRQWHLADKGRESMPIVADPDRCCDPEVHPKTLRSPLRRYNLRSNKGRKPSS